jgi:heme A synthase
VKFVITERAETITHQPFNKWLHWLAISVAAMSVILIAAGALVTSTKSGDAIPDWPTSYGALIPSYLAGGVLFEWSHRVIAGFTALLVFALALALVFQFGAEVVEVDGHLGSVGNRRSSGLGWA